MIPDPTPVRRLVIVLDTRACQDELADARAAAEWQLTAAGEYSIDGTLVLARWDDQIVEEKVAQYIRCTTLPDSVADQVARGVMKIARGED